MRILAVIGALGLCLGMKVMAQVPGAASGGVEAAVGSPSAPVSVRSPNQKQPYTMELTETLTQTFAGGLTVTRTQIWRTARSADGRRRMEIESTSSRDHMVGAENVLESDHVKTNFVTIMDAKAGKSLTWTVQPGAPMVVRVSHVGPRPAEGKHSPVVPPEQTQEHGALAQRVREQLGTKTMFGVEVTGSRTTTTFPAGFKDNNVTYQETDETWYASGYAETFERTTESPLGKTTKMVTAFTPGEPDAALFEAPAGYRIVGDRQ